MKIASILRWIADVLEDPEPVPAPTRPVVPARDRPDVPLFDRDLCLAAARREDAMSLMDGEVLAYAMVQARGDLAGDVEIVAKCGVDDFAWPAMSATMARMVIEGDRVHGG